MSHKRILPCLDIRNGRVVKGQQFKNVVDVEDPLTLARTYDEAGADELVMYDITATTEGRTFFLKTIQSIAREISIPLTVGGGIRTIWDIEQVVSAGAQKVSINSAAIRNPSLINEAATQFGSAAVVIAIDAKQVEPHTWHAFTHGGKKDTGIDALQWAKEAVKRGAGELVINSMDEDGMKTGFNLPLQEAMRSVVSVPLIASGGAGSLDDFKEVFESGAADGALAASVFHYGELSIQDVKAYIQTDDIVEEENQMNIDLDSVVFDSNGILPAIVQDEQTGDVLMLAYVNKEALQKSIETKETWFYSRSRKKLWNKGATSGNRQQITQITFDCDQDALLFSVIPQGPACHTGETSCFYNDVWDHERVNRSVLTQLTERIADRRANPKDGAYTTYLFNEGVDKILKKIGEEASEVIIGAKNNDKQEVIWEIADLTYHTLVLMEQLDIPVSDIQRELTKRHITKEAKGDE